MILVRFLSESVLWTTLMSISLFHTWKQVKDALSEEFSNCYFFGFANVLLVNCRAQPFPWASLGEQGCLIPVLMVSYTNWLLTAVTMVSNFSSASRQGGKKHPTPRQNVHLFLSQTIPIYVSAHIYPRLLTSSRSFLHNHKHNCWNKKNKK